MSAGRSPARVAPPGPLRIAAAQLRSVAGDLPANVAAAAASVRRAADAGARVVVLPEKVLSGYEPELVAAAPSVHALQPQDPRLDPVRQACASTGVVAVVGAATLREGVLRISAVALDASGADAATYDKRFLYGSEEAVYTAGERDVLLGVDGWRIGLGICYDSGFPEHAAGLAADGAHVYLVGALFSRGNGEREIAAWFPDRAKDNRMYAVLANHVGVTGGWNACGGSAVWAPDGTPLAVASPDVPELVVADLDPTALG